MKSYEPNERDTFIKIKSGDFQRLIWAEPRDLVDREKKHWEVFEK